MARIKFTSNLLFSLRGIWFVLSRPIWLITAVVLAFLISSIIYFSINFGFYGALLGSSLPFLDKLHTVGLLLQDMVQSYITDGTGALLLVVSLLQGGAVAVVIFTVRCNRSMDAAVVGRSGFALFFAILGLGCVPCGTSLLVPIMTLIFSSSAPALLGTANTVVLVLALLLTVYSLYKTGLVAYKYKIAEEIT